jgi:outer membrane protein
MFSAVILLSAISSANAAELKIGVFDGNVVLSRAPQIEMIDAKMQKMFKEQIDEMTALNQQGVDMRDDFQKNSVTMTEAQQIKIKRDLAQIGTDLQTKNKNFQEDLKREKSKEFKVIQNRIRQIVNKIAADENFDLILLSEVAAFHKPSLDITEKIITILSNPAG